MITADMLIEDIIEHYPETIKPLQELGVQCIVCGEPVWGTLAEQVERKNLSNLDEILLHLNKVINR